MSHRSEAFFLQVEGGQRYCIHHRASEHSRGNVVYIHPFAEEMNKSRRMAAVQARAIAEAGYDVLQIDLLGCGDSSGDFADATWSAWLDDVVRAGRWMQQRSSAPLALWGLRAGCLLAVGAAPRLDAGTNGTRLVLWQPPAAGKPLLQQFLRLKMAAQLEGGANKGVVEGLRQQLSQGVAVEVAGYTVGPALAAGLDAATLQPPSVVSAVRRVAWCELSPRDPPEPLPASAVAIARFESAGFEVQSHVVAGPAFWQTTEIEEAPLLVHSTLESLRWVLA